MKKPLMKPIVKLKIDNGKWVCEDTNTVKGIGDTPYQAWYNYTKKVIDNVIEVVYNYENSF